MPNQAIDHYLFIEVNKLRENLNLKTLNLTAIKNNIAYRKSKILEAHAQKLMVEIEEIKKKLKELEGKAGVRIKSRASGAARRKRKKIRNLQKIQGINS